MFIKIVVVFYFLKFSIVEENTKLATEVVISYIEPVIVLTIPLIHEKLSGWHI